MILLTSSLFKKLALLLIGGLSILSFVAYMKYDDIRSSLDNYASRKAQEQFGARSLAPEQEEKIASLAREMGITESITIRTMNHAALSLFGYYNAFAYFFVFLDLIPISTKPFLFISEGFFEDLTPEEQRFLIGHELIHVQERHTLYLNLVIYLLWALLLCGAVLVRKYLVRVIKNSRLTKHQRYLPAAVSVLLIVASTQIPALISSAYRRHIEREADIRSLQILHSFDGCTKLLQRWQKDFNVDTHNPFFSILSDHPSCSERNAYCLALKDTIQRNHS
jgi:Zn-dependent protease with chaperone function